MNQLSLKYVGVNKLPVKLSEFELERLFSLSTEEIAAIRARFRRDHQVGAAVQLLFLRVAGRGFDAYQLVPRQLLAHLGRQLDIASPTIASLRSLYRRPNTLHQHQQWACAYLELNIPTEHQLRMLYTRLKEQADHTLAIDDLVRFGARWLYNAKLIIPGDRVLRHMACRAFSESEDKTLAAIQAVVTKSQFDQWVIKLFEPRPKLSITTLEWLKTPPGKRTPSTLADAFRRVTLLKELGIHELIFDAIPIEKQRTYAMRLAARRPAKFKKLALRTQMLELVCFLQVSLLDWTDTVLQFSGMRALDIVRRAKRTAQAKRLASAAQYHEQLVAVKTVLADTDKDAEARIAAAQALLIAVDAEPATHAAAVRAVLANDHGRVRVVLKHLVSLNPNGDDNDDNLRNLTLLNNLYAQQRTELPADTQADVPRAWKALVEDKDRGRAFRALEAATLLGLHKSIRRGSIWVGHSLSFREHDRLLIPADRWPKERARHLTKLNMSADPDKFLKPILGALKVGLAAVDEAIHRGDLTIDDKGVIHLSPLKALPIDVEPIQTRDLLYREIGPIQLPDLMLEMDSHLRFSWTLLGHAPTRERELLALYGALLAQGTELDVKGVALMTPGLESAQVSAMMRLLEADGKLRAANDLAVEFIRKHPVAKIWGDGLTASSDMMSLEASQHLWNARIDPRRRTYSIGLYTTLLDQHGIIYDQPIVLNQRQAGAAIEGAIRQNHTKLASLAVDTHGFTYLAMCLAKMLGFDLLPRLSDLKDRKLYVPKGFEVPEPLRAAVESEVSLKIARRGYDGLLRLVASIDSGKISTPLALERFGSAARGDAVFEAGDQIGRLLRTLFLCDYFTNEDFRRAIHKILNRGESVHALQRAIYTGRLAPERGRRQEEMIAISGSHALLTNLVLAWNTHRIQITVDRWKSEGKSIEDAWLARISPAHVENINLRGTFSFTIDPYRDVLIASRTTAAG